MAFNLDKLFNKSEFVSSGTIGGKIKKIREIRDMTQKELGFRCGYSSNTADVRIAQYEKNTKIPREKAKKEIASALNIDDNSLFDADLCVTHTMYHALFDIEDFHGLHPIKIGQNYYLEFGGKTVLGHEVFKYEFDSFLSLWHEMYEKYKPLPSDTPEEIKKKYEEYTIWRYEYPINISRENSERLKNHMRMHHLQAEMDSLYAEMNSKTELKKIDEAAKDKYMAYKKEYKDIDKISDVIYLIKEMLENNIYVSRYTPSEEIEKDYSYFHVISFKSSDILNDETTMKYYVRFLCQIDTLKKAGIEIEPYITSKDKELYISYQVPSKQIEYIKNIVDSWSTIEYIVEREGIWSDLEIKNLEKDLSDKITGENDLYLEDIKL